MVKKALRVKAKPGSTINLAIKIEAGAKSTKIDQRKRPCNCVQ